VLEKQCEVNESQNYILTPVGLLFCSTTLPQLWSRAELWKGVGTYFQFHSGFDRERLVNQCKNNVNQQIDA
jgi:hypothetical protein